MNDFTNYYGMMPDAMIRQYCRGESPMIYPFVDYDHPLSNNDVISFGLTSTGYDIRVGRKFYVFKGTHAAKRIDSKNFDPSLFDEINIAPGEVFWLPPQGFALCHSAESFNMPRDVRATCLGKSTYARCGVDIHVTPLEAGWRAKSLTVEISSEAPLPIAIYPMEGIAQLEFTRIPGIERTYADKKGKYMDQDGITLPRMRQPA